MTTLTLTFITLILVISLMSVGVIFGKKPISGSCGGIKAFGKNGACELCGNDPSKCIK